MEQGKHKKKLNAVDVVIIVVVAALLVLGAYKLFMWEKVSEEPSEKLVYTVEVTGQDPSVYASIQKYIPGKLIASGADVNGQVLSVKQTPSDYYVPVGEGSNEIYLGPVKNKDQVDLVFTIEAFVSTSDLNLNKVGTQEVRIGKTHVIKTRYLEFSGTVLSAAYEK
ncbi:MAG: DUF4330 family protein [Oscillospiraceae bacterium]|nr:DUF4330 family protein [Oscillospiraceae bacterium]